MREILEFSPNVPAQVALAYGVGKTIETKFGERVMFTLADGRIMFLEPEVAEKVNELKLRANQPFFICKHRDGKRGSPVEWRAWLSPDLLAGEQPDGTFVVPANGNGKAAASVLPPAAVTAASKLPRTPSNGNGSKPMGPHGTAPAPSIDVQNGWARLLAQTNALVDVYAAALNYASEKHGNQVKADDVRCLLTTAYINQARNGGSHGA
ncbi:MAG: hypothetical protein ABSD56_00080 [Bryobacteraceae bacterium]|jgi:hypothetical protein